MRERFIAGALAVGLLTAGCSAETPEQTPTTVTVTVENTVTVTAEAPQPRTILDVDQLPATLPPAVADTIDNSVKVTFFTELNTPIQTATGTVLTNSMVDASGVKIADGTFLTAGHALRDPDNKPLDNINTCGRLTVQLTSDEFLGSRSEADGSITPYKGASFDAQKSWGSRPDYKGVDRILGDIGIFQTDTLQPENTGFAEISLSQPHANDTVYMANFEPTADAIRRNPYEVDLSLQDMSNGLGTAAIYGGVVGGYMDDGRMMVIEGLQNYGQHSETVTRGGGSGGGVYNAQGELVGLTQSVSTLSERQINEIHKVTFSDNNPDSQIAVQLVQPVTPQIAERLQAELTQAPSCEKS